MSLPLSSLSPPSVILNSIKGERRVRNLDNFVRGREEGSQKRYRFVVAVGTRGKKNVESRELQSAVPERESPAELV